MDSSLVYDVYHKGINISRISLRVPGEHNVLNSLAAFIVAHECCGVENRFITKALGKFIGANDVLKQKVMLLASGLSMIMHIIQQKLKRP